MKKNRLENIKRFNYSGGSANNTGYNTKINENHFENSAKKEKEKHRLSKEDIVKELCAKTKNIRNCAFCTGFIPIFFSAIFLFGGLNFNSIILLALLAALSLFCFIVAIIKTYTLKKIKKLDFYITVETCNGKYDYSDNIRYFLILSSGEKYRIDFSYKGVGYDRIFQNSFYKSAYKGEKYYAFRLNNKKILLLIPTDMTELNFEEFEICNSCIRPRKDKWTIS